ncbi:MAG: hypothetical protein IJF07_09355 [Lachnospiraceae bacterium]|nr:hypothetical protein [Lachnospiraceae bacterium]
MENGGIYENGVSLTPGVYQLRMMHEKSGSEDGKLVLQAYNAHFYGLLADTILVDTQSKETISEFYVTASIGAEDSPVVLEYQGTEPLTITELEITKTNKGARIWVVSILMGSFLINSLVMLYVYWGKYSVTLKEVITYFGTLALAALASMPVFTDYLIQNLQLNENLQRIELLAAGKPDFSFQSKLFWMLPAFFRWVGFPVGVCYSIFIIVINLATVWVTYMVFTRLFQNCCLGIFGSILYTLMPYRLECIYGMGDVGEVLAMIFLPVVCYGWYLLFAPAKKQYTEDASWLVLGLGLSGILHAKLLSLGIVLCFMILAGLLQLKAVVAKKTFIRLLKVTGVILVCNLWYLLPVVEVAVKDYSWYETIAGRHIQEYGIRLEHISFHMQYLGVLAIVIGIVVFLSLARRYQNNNCQQGGIRALVVGVVAWILSTAYFPWGAIQISNRITGTLIPLLGSPARLQSVAAICLVIVVCIAGYWMLDQRSVVERVLYFGSVGGCYLLAAIYQVNSILENSAQIVRPYMIKTPFIGGGVYEAPWYWYVAKLISVIGIFLLVWHINKKRRKR